MNFPSLGGRAEGLSSSGLWGSCRLLSFDYYPQMREEAKRLTGNENVKEDNLRDMNKMLSKVKKSTKWAEVKRYVT